MAARGRIFSPRPDDITTSFSTEARDLGTEVTGEDLETLREGVEEGLRQLPELVIEKREGDAIGDLVTLEYWFTFREAETARSASAGSASPTRARSRCA